jgi:outer membrane receptor protein involved in Fe transport
MPAFAQQQAAPTTAPSEEAAPAEVVITGSRIQSPNITAISPVTTVTQADIAATGLTRTEDILNQLPQVFAAQNATVSNGSDGTATIDLRGLGAQRTLVLVNGRRLGPGAGDGRNFSDINEVPAALIERVDVLTGGASSVYGADAVAGVVNFVLNTHFEGVKIDANYSFDQHSNGNSIESTVTARGFPLPAANVETGFEKNFSILAGSNFLDNKGNATFYVTYDKQAATLQSKYDYSSCSLGAARTTGARRCGGSGTSAKNGAGGYFQAYGAFMDPTAAYHNAAGYVTDKNGNVLTQPLFTNTVDGLTGQFRPYTSSDLYNFGPLNFFLRPSERWTAGAFVNYEVNSHATVYGEAMFTRNLTQAQIAPSGDFFTASFIPCNNPEMTAQEQSTICSPANIAAQAAAGFNTTEVINGVPVNGINMYIGRRNVEGGGRIATFDKNAFRAVVGVKGQIDDAWSYDISGQHTTVDDSNGNLNYFSAVFVNNALNTVGVDATGTPVPYGTPGAVANCAVASGDKNCVPWNIWVKNGVTAAATKYLSVPLLVNDSVTEEILSGSMTGDLGKYGIKSPAAEDGLLVNAGFEYRSEALTFSPDLLSEQGNAEGSGGPTTPLSGNFHVNEGYLELGVPLVQHKPLAESLSFEAGYRYSSYSLGYDTNPNPDNPQTSSGFNTNTYKFGVEWSPVSDFRIRASYQHAVRAPNIGELFGATSVQLDGSSDPCAGAAPTASVQGCTLTGVSPAQYGSIGANPAAQYNGLTGGNPNLKPEKADTYSGGIVFKPSYVPNFVASIDYFNIDITNVIGTIGADTILNECIASQDANSSFCQDIHRDPNGSLWRTQAGFVRDTLINFGEQGTRGIDLNASYRLPLGGMGSLGFNLEGTDLMALFFRPLTGGPSYDCTGFYGATCGNPAPAWRSVFKTTWATPWSGLDLSARWRYFGAVSSELDSSNPQLAGNSSPGSSHIPAFSYIDLSASVSLYKGVRLMLGVNNVFDKDPPIVDSGGNHFGSNCPTGPCNGNTFPGVYDALGRFVYAHVSAEF